jgi:hypothetical protein
VASLRAAVGTPSRGTCWDNDDAELACWCSSSVDAAMLFAVAVVVDAEEQDGDAATGFSSCTRSLGGGNPKS